MFTLLLLLVPAAGAPPARPAPPPLAAPELPDLARFPWGETSIRVWYFALHLERHLAERQWIGFDSPEFIAAWLDDVRTVRGAWDALSDAHNANASLEWRQQRLADLRRLLGEDAWWAGRMPLLDARFFEGY